MSAGYRVVDIRAGLVMPVDRSELDQIPATDAPDLEAALEPAADALKPPRLGAIVPAGVDTQDAIIPNGWFG
jgi:hypothetical protein